MKNIIISACFINFALVSMGFATSTGMSLNQNINAALHSEQNHINHNQLLMGYAGQDLANRPSLSETLNAT